MTTHNICIRREIIKILCGYPLLSVAMSSLGSKRDLSNFRTRLSMVRN